MDQQVPTERADRQAELTADTPVSDEPERQPRQSPERTQLIDAPFTVADEGVGIPAQDREKIFRLYYTTKSQGSGIGLSMVYRIVQMHDGRIDVESEVDRGTVMVLTLPVAPKGVKM